MYINCIVLKPVKRKGDKHFVEFCFTFNNSQLKLPATHSVEINDITSKKQKYLNNIIMGRFILTLIH